MDRRVNFGVERQIATTFPTQVMNSNLIQSNKEQQNVRKERLDIYFNFHLQFPIISHVCKYESFYHQSN